MNVLPGKQIVSTASFAVMGSYLVGGVNLTRFCFNKLMDDQRPVSAIKFWMPYTNMAQGVS
jgi:hypothetical protein